MNASNTRTGASNSKPGAASAPSALNGAASPGIKVVKRQAAAPVEASREKPCSQCGRPFKLSPEQKFHLCPRCFQKAQSKRPAPPRRGTQVLTQITCMACGIQEYLTIVPTDPSKALCGACHTASRSAPSQDQNKTPREPKAIPQHPNTR